MGPPPALVTRARLRGLPGFVPRGVDSFEGDPISQFRLGAAGALE
jgi:hypothetical protein